MQIKMLPGKNETFVRLWIIIHALVLSIYKF